MTLTGRAFLTILTCVWRRAARQSFWVPNGAGKSLLLRLCHGLLTPTHGTLSWGKTEAKQHQAMVFQKPVLLRRSAEANINLALQLHHHRRKKRHALVAQALELAGLARYARRPARVLSGGEQQRLAIARAWALKPHVLFLDEPTSNLDPAATRQVESPD